MVCPNPADDLSCLKTCQCRSWRLTKSADYAEVRVGTFSSKVATCSLCRDRIAILAQDPGDPDEWTVS